MHPAPKGTQNSPRFLQCDRFNKHINVNRSSRSSKRRCVGGLLKGLANFASGDPFTESSLTDLDEGSTR